MKTRNQPILLAALGLTMWVIQACSSGSSSLQSGMNCAISAAQDTTRSNAVALSISCGGGTAPYSVASLTLAGATPDSVTGTSTGFSSTTTLTVYDYSYSNFSGLAGTVAVYDSASVSSQAVGYSFTVTTSSGSTSTGSCTIAAGNSSPSIGQSVTFTLTTDTFGSSPYTFNSFSAGSYGTVSQSPVKISDTQSQAVASFSQTGTQTVSASVYDNMGATRSCSTTVTVGGTSTTTGSGSLSCAGWASPTAISRGQGTTVGVTITSSYQAWLQEVHFAPNMGITGSYTSATTAQLYFPYSGTYPITFLVKDINGNQATCNSASNVTVY
ncbi:hypothetical protein K2X33_16665 [bacterium]|nr:hypothetical protein [bacterium]